MGTPLAILALAISVGTFIHTFWKTKYERRYEAEKKRTELLGELDMLIILQETLKFTVTSTVAPCRQCDNPISAHVLDAAEWLEKSSDMLIEQYSEMKKKVESTTTDNPVILEKVIPQVREHVVRLQKQVRIAETMQKEYKPVPQHITPRILVPGESGGAQPGVTQP